MSTFFYGWRRKFGVVTLLMACMVMTGWMTSRKWQEDFAVPFTVRYQWIVIFRESHFIISEMRDIHDDNDMSDNIKPSIALRYLLSNRYDGLDPIVVDRFGYYHKVFAKYGFRGVVFPCWSIVTALTVLSAVLLLSRPSKLIQTKLVEPVPVLGT